eukprot:TRINITY_DN1955_c0_g5_i1.p1 TRINITY_DN1955_c0_g5~~TRINITY_DN1955_c0_g5_i1.p1  ORF type:complete len:406 (-),score=51.24 TRINITY_DN1955_c0_g5_i1:220-1437(-)
MKVLTILLIVLGVLVLVGAGVFAYIEFKPHKFQLHLVTSANGASCLDGTAPGYYLREGKGDGKKKYVIYFQGGSWCQGLSSDDVLQSCYNILGTDLGSSKNWPKTKEFDGILSNSQSSNPDFYNWNQVVINYCDGSLHQGYIKDPIIYQSKQIYFRGQINTVEILDELQGKHGLNAASDVIVAGFDSGVIALYQWIDYIKTKYLSSTVNYHGIADSGYYIDFLNYESQSYQTRFQIQQLWKLVDAATSVPNTNCVASVLSSNQWQCLFPQYISKYVSAPIFVIQSLYDIWVLDNNAGMSCVSEKTSSLDSCSDVIDYIESYKTVISNKIVNNLQPNSGVWQIACAFHDISFVDSAYFTSASWQVTVSSANYTAQTALSKWLSGGVSSYVDQSVWPNNSKCARINF